MSLLGLDRKLDPELRDELDALPSSCDDNGFGGQLAHARVELPTLLRRPERAHPGDPNLRAASECLQDGLRPVEVAVLVAPRSSGECLGP